MHKPSNQSVFITFKNEKLKQRHNYICHELKNGTIRGPDMRQGQ